MLCFASLLIFGILSIFSAKYRSLAGEALDCVFRRVTLRPCTTGFDVKIKSTLLSWILKRSPVLAKLISRRFDLIAFIFLFVFLFSAAYSIRGIYNYWAFGNCNGLNQGGFCAFDPAGENNAVSGTGVGCKVGGGQTGNLTLNNVDLVSFYQTKGSEKELVFIGCYACKYSKMVYPIIKQLAEKYNPTIRWVFYPAHQESQYLTTYDYCMNKQYPDKYLEWMDRMYATPLDLVASESATLKLIESMNINREELFLCTLDPKSQEASLKQKYEIDKTGLYGTPTIFLNDTPVVGPKPERVYRRLLTGSWF